AESQETATRGRRRELKFGRDYKDLLLLYRSLSTYLGAWFVYLCI
ncbi:unnamed protein product, partial [Musa acuminata var. zebrina]